eukprot:986546_1
MGIRMYQTNLHFMVNIVSNALGKCFACDTLEEPNPERTGYEFYHPWWLYLLEIVSGLTCFGGLCLWLIRKGLICTPKPHIHSPIPMWNTHKKGDSSTDNANNQNQS